MSKVDLIESAKLYATFCHYSTNHLYDHQPYSVYLKLVVKYAEKYSYLIPKDLIETVISASWCHDVIEDTRQTYNDVKKVLGEDIADIVYALTNNKGKTRSERANLDYYIGIKNTRYATFVKLCDRLANVTYSKSKGNNKKFNMYKKENTEFKAKLFQTAYSDMFEELDSLFIN